MRTARFASLFLLLALPCLAQDGKVEPLDALTDIAVPEAVRAVLEPKGYRLKLDDGSVACEIWLRDKVPAQPKKDGSTVAYPQLATSMLLGVVSFPQASMDYRGQTIKPGFYTLRYALMPNDGNHLGVAPNRDFLLLISPGSDKDPAAVFTFEELVQLSRRATGAGHPGPMSLAQPEGSSAPALSLDSEEHWIFSAGWKLDSGQEMPFSLVVKGTAPQ